MGYSSVQAILGWVLFAWLKQTPLKYAVLESVLRSTEAGGLAEQVIWAFWFYSEIIVVGLAGYFLLALAGSLLLVRTVEQA